MKNMFCKKNKRNFKRAVSPLIATILLVAVALSLAGILYSWSSQNAKETTDNLSETTSNWNDCSAVNLYIDYGCSYDSETGLSFIVMDNSTVEIDNNLSLIVIDADNEITSATFEPDFQNTAMSVKTEDLSNAEDFHDLAEPIKRVKIFVNSCPDKADTTTSCN